MGKSKAKQPGSLAAAAAAQLAASQQKTKATTPPANKSTAPPIAATSSAVATAAATSAMTTSKQTPQSALAPTCSSSSPSSSNQPSQEPSSRKLSEDLGEASAVASFHGLHTEQATSVHPPPRNQPPAAASRGVKFAAPPKATSAPDRDTASRGWGESGRGNAATTSQMQPERPAQRVPPPPESKRPGKRGSLLVARQNVEAARAGLSSGNNVAEVKLDSNLATLADDFFGEGGLDAEDDRLALEAQQKRALGKGWSVKAMRYSLIVRMPRNIPSFCCRNTLRSCPCSVNPRTRGGLSVCQRGFSGCVCLQINLRVAQRIAFVFDSCFLDGCTAPHLHLY